MHRNENISTECEALLRDCMANPRHIDDIARENSANLSMLLDADNEWTHIYQLAYTDLKGIVRVSVLGRMLLRAITAERELAQLKGLP